MDARAKPARSCPPPTVADERQRLLARRCRPIPRRTAPSPAWYPARRHRGSAVREITSSTAAPATRRGGCNRRACTPPRSGADARVAATAERRSPALHVNDQGGSTAHGVEADFFRNPAWSMQFRINGARPASRTRLGPRRSSRTHALPRRPHPRILCGSAEVASGSDQTDVAPRLQPNRPTPGTDRKAVLGVQDPSTRASEITTYGS
jgi:hypothetical protein